MTARCPDATAPRDAEASALARRFVAVLAALCIAAALGSCSQSDPAPSTQPSTPAPTGPTTTLPPEQRALVDQLVAAIDQSGAAGPYAFDVRIQINDLASAAGPTACLTGDSHSVQVVGAMDRSTAKAWFADGATSGTPGTPGTPGLIVVGDEAWLHSASAWGSPDGWLLVSANAVPGASSWLTDRFLVSVDTPSSTLFAAGGALTSPVAFFEGMDSVLGDAELVDDEPLDGQPAQHLRMTLPGAIDGGAPADQPTLDVWIVEGRIGRALLQGPVADPGTPPPHAIDARFSAYGEPVDVEAPAEAERVTLEQLGGAELAPIGPGCDPVPLAG